MEVSSLMGIFHYHYHIRDKPYSHLKPGQKSLERDYYSKATHEQPDGKAVLSNYGRFDSVYNQNVATAVKPGDYKVPSKNANTMSKSSDHLTIPVQYEFAHNPDLFAHTRFGRTEMRKTMQDGALSNAGKSAVEFNKTGMSGASSSSKALATSHWKTMYQGTVEQTLSQPA
jgi:hypothetical protein